MSFADTVRKWFSDEWGGSLFLPDGWYGRPYDNQHALTSVEETGSTLIMVLDQKLTLRFEGLRSVKAQKRALTIGPFDSLRFDWETFDADGRRGTKEYGGGEVKILAGP